MNPTATVHESNMMHVSRIHCPLLVSSTLLDSLRNNQMKNYCKVLTGVEFDLSYHPLCLDLIDQTVSEFAERDVKIAGLLIVQPWCYVHCIEVDKPL